ncbi:Gibberellin regulated protein [Dioscorea alata]|uniref:Gibberellin regulated protein n=1 Tax=Dioscorea alata TaxID=55571 RepID=A0ACB7WCE2_DIOAL|nr:Gibberellin regulated protein [Dioscorea alata]
MAKLNKAMLALLLIIILELDAINGGSCSAGTQTIDCIGKCQYRCSKASRHNMCINACMVCCERCNCVPPGTSGNRDVCPCYAKMKTHGGRLKCP